ncbi:Hypothetical protein I595_219 [Croceitalea dokdonensis DOKDO 023]|uniref:DNA primase n=1 Tax=Croceitalea dokdonensis DOKDO 023 TaxID=1300341 RepID=A0A0N8H4G6_9FLAO|nr:hypothetical protein [Croceitalea dokdonensis]KPM33316.1 Hypothetical protein I595_219 [Croceitalea dokdonensis DOKDO 023]
MRRIIIDYKKLDHSLAAKLIDTYPHGYGDDDIIVLKKPGGELVEAVEITTDDTVYLVKISKSLSSFIANFEDSMEKELNDDKLLEENFEPEDN